MRGVCDKVAVSLLIYEVAPAPDWLRQKQTGRDIIGNFHRILFLDFRHYIHGDVAENHSAVYAQTSVAESEKVAPALLVAVVRKGEEINSRSEYGKRQDKQRVIETVVRVLAVLFKQLRKNHYCQHHARHDYQRVIGYPQSPYFHGGTWTHLSVEIEKRLVEVEYFEQ